MNTSQGSTRGYCSNSPGDNETGASPHFMVTHIHGGALVSVNQCSWCRWIDFEDIDAQVREHLNSRSEPAPRRDRRLRECVAAWPEAETGAYDPRCCRFPKSCSATVYDEDNVTEDDLEPPFPGRYEA